MPTLRSDAGLPVAGKLACLLILAAASLSGGCAGLAASGAPELPGPPVAFSDTVMISNGLVKLGVAPSVGRVVHFSRDTDDAANILWISPADQSVPDARGYTNWGGDKLWLLPQCLWPRAFGHPTWPPDGVIDGQPWTLVSHSPSEIVMESPASKPLGVVVQRSFQLVQGRPEVRVTNTTRRVAPSVFPVNNWTVTQITHPEYHYLDIASDRLTTGEPFRILKGKPERVGEAVKVLGNAEAVGLGLPPGPGAKIGTHGRWVAGLYARDVLVLSTGYEPTGAYPEDSSAQVYTDPKYTELELLSQFVHLQVGEELENTVRWQLLPRPAGDVRAVLATIRQAVE